MMDTKAEPKKSQKSRLDWFLWWRIDNNELSMQIAGYDTLKPWKSARGTSVLCLLFSAAVSVMMINSNKIESSSYFDVAIFIILSVFIYMGHRWALISAMGLWTLEKGIILYSSTSYHTNPLVQVIWWAIYMHAFYLSFRVEQGRRALKSAGEQLTPQASADGEVPQP